jgi:hypothetical protein
MDFTRCSVSFSLAQMIIYANKKAASKKQGAFVIQNFMRDQFYCIDLTQQATAPVRAQ